MTKLCLISLIIFSLYITLSDGDHLDNYQQYNSRSPALEDEAVYRSERNTYEDRSRPEQVRFGWQNPIRTAPTLSPRYYQQPNYNLPPTPTPYRPQYTPPPTRYYPETQPPQTLSPFLRFPPSAPPPYNPFVPTRATTYPPTPNPYRPTPPPTRYYPETQPSQTSPPPPYDPFIPTRAYPSPNYPTFSPESRNKYNPPAKPNVPNEYPEQGLPPTQPPSRRWPQPPPKEEEFERLPGASAQTQSRERPEPCTTRSRRFRQNGKCYELGTRGPCNQNMLFYIDPVSPQEYGDCDCTHGLTRPLVYHPQTDKCYFIFQQAYCKEGEWLVIDRNNRPSCDINRCTDWTEMNVQRNYNWTFNYQELEFVGPVAILNERKCSALGWPCSAEGTQNLASLIIDGAGPGQSQISQEGQPEVKLRFSGANLVCSRETEPSEFQLESETFSSSVCQEGMVNKRRLSGKCN